MVRVLLDHAIVASHPSGSKGVEQPDGSMVVTEPGGTATTYVAGGWHAVGEEPPCAFVTPNPQCPRCYHPTPVVVPSGPLAGSAPQAL